MNITIDEVKYIAKLAKLKFTESEAEKFALEFEKILQHFHSLDKLDLTDVELNNFYEYKSSVVRADSNTVYEDKDKLFSNVKVMRETYIQVPKIIE